VPAEHASGDLNKSGSDPETLNDDERAPDAASNTRGQGGFSRTLPLIASAQGPQSRPSYAADEEVVRGRIVSFDGQYSLELQDERGFIDQVRLRQSTIVQPIGLEARDRSLRRMRFAGGETPVECHVGASELTLTFCGSWAARALPRLSVRGS
jgi:hypothetical protein